MILFVLEEFKRSPALSLNALKWSQKKNQNNKSYMSSPNNVVSKSIPTEWQHINTHTHAHKHTRAYTFAHTVTYTQAHLKQMSPVFLPFIQLFTTSHKSTGSQKKWENLIKLETKPMISSMEHLIFKTEKKCLLFLLEIQTPPHEFNFSLPSLV